MNSLSIYIADKIKILTDNLEKGLQTKDVEALEAAKAPIDEIQGHVRESIQASLRLPVEDLVKKLRHDKDLTPEDLRIIEKWVVGDAQHYVEIENNFKDWIAECERLGNHLGTFNDPKFKEDQIQLFKLNAFLTDLKFTLSDVIRYLEAQDRVNRFKNFVESGNITKEDKKWLADLIGRQLVSPDF